MSHITSHTLADLQRPLQLQFIGPAGEPSAPAPADVVLEGHTLVGQGSECQLRLAYATVSRRHAMLERTAGQWLLSDLGSRNGTFLNGQRLEPRTSVPLAHGDHIRFPPAVFRVMLREGQTQSTTDDRLPPTHVEPIRDRPSPRVGQEMLRGLIRASAAIHSAPDERSLWSELISAALALTGFQRGAVLRHGPAVDGVEICAIHPGQPGDFEFSRTLVHAAAAGRPVFLRSSAPMPPSTSIMSLGISSAACIPLLLDGAVWGSLYLDSRGNEPGHTSPSHTRQQAEEVCGTLVEMGAMALSGLLRRGVQERLALLQREAELAGQAQRLLLPPAEGRLAGMQYALRFCPGRLVSGDLVGVVALDEQRSAVFVGDVTGKGLGAGLVMAAIQGLLTASLLRCRDAQMAMNELNMQLADRLPLGCFASLWVGVYDAAAGVLVSVDAGHGMAYVSRRGSGRVEALSSDGGAWLGAQAGGPYAGTRHVLVPGSRVIIVSDGLIEQPGPDGAQFGVERLRGALAGSTSPRQDVESLARAVGDFAATDQFRDDLTALSIQFESR
jgi:phosphoserine phosphatase RsbU/P